MTRYAWLEVTAILLIGGGLTAGLGFWAGWAWALLPAGLMLALLSFYRDPPRRIVADPLALLAPADGRIIRIERGAELDDGPGPGLRIVIFLSVFNVHVNRSPCAGRVTGVQHEPGLYLNALRADATERNERNTLTLAPEAPLPGPVRVRQIAGLLAKRIVCAVRVGDSLSSGQRFGMIKLGSQTEVRAPDDGGWEVLARVGQRVQGGLTVLARRRTNL